MRRAALLLLFPLMAGCGGEAPCRVTLVLPSALTAVPEGVVREVPLRCGEETVAPGSWYADTLGSDTPGVASVHESHAASLAPATWYLLAHAPGTCRLTARLAGQEVATFDVRVVAR